MKLLGKYIMYSLIVALLIIGSLLLIKNHPEVQFAFLMPGIFVIAYAIIHDDLFRRHTPVRNFRGR